MELLVSLDYYHWMLLGLLLLVGEAFVGGAFLMWIGVSSLILGAVVLVLGWVGVELSWAWQLTLFGVGMLGAIHAWKRYVPEMPPMEAPALNQRGRDHVGKVVALRTAIENGEGYVTLDDTRWRVTGPDLPAGHRVRLVALNDLVFTVEATDS